MKSIIKWIFKILETKRERKFSQSQSNNKDSLYMLQQKQQMPPNTNFLLISFGMQHRSILQKK